MGEDGWGGTGAMRIRVGRGGGRESQLAWWEGGRARFGLGLAVARARLVVRSRRVEDRDELIDETHLPYSADVTHGRVP